MSAGADSEPVLACLAVVGTGLLFVLAGLVGARRQVRPRTPSEKDLETATAASLRNQLRLALERERDAREEAQHLGAQLARAKAELAEAEVTIDAQEAELADLLQRRGA